LICQKDIYFLKEKKEIMYNENSVPECTYMERVHVKGAFSN
jgi:hypothetical protein